VLFAPRGAAAQSGTGGTISSAAALSTSDFTFFLESYNKDQKQWVQMNTTEQQFFFNRARCECDGDTTNWSGYFVIAIQSASTTSTKVAALLTQNLLSSGRAAIFAGGNATNCLDPNNVLANDTCLNLIEPGNQAAGIEGGITAIVNPTVWKSSPIPAAWLFNSTTRPICTSAAACNSTAKCETAAPLTATIYIWVQTTALQTPDLTNLSFNVNLVGQVSFAPTNIRVQGGNEALTVRWDWPTGLNPSANPTFMGTQIFCVRGADLPVFKSGTFGDPAYMTSSGTKGICPNIAPASSSTGILGLDPAFLCSDLRPSTETSHRIWKLQNGIDYGVGVAAIDKYGNASVISNLVDGTPVPTVDFYTEYKTSGGAAQGGYCALAKGMRSPGLLALAGLAAFGLLWWRRRKGRGPGAGPLAVVFVTSALCAGQARAQAVYHDDSIIEDHAKEDWKGTPREFAIEARFALYTPAIDSEFSKGTKPQSFMFGGQKRPMWQLELDWEVLQVFGTLALGGVVGYYKENANACYLSSLTPTNCDPSGDNTSLRLIPLAALVVYRFDVLAEEWKIPLVPYGKVGLNYTFWNVTDGNGNTPYVGGGKGKGGTAGWQAAVGISLQLDWLDPSAARGFDADAGVNHSYAFFELDTIQSSGLGSSNKLHVGDNTWFAGLMFEF
jgi:hypothetical protein